MYIKKKEFFEYETLLANEFAKLKRISAKAMQRKVYYKNKLQRIQIQYCDTIIVDIDLLNGKIRLNSDSWYSVTTKKYMNDILYKYNLCIQQYNYSWYIIKDNNYIKDKKDLKEKLKNGRVIEYNNNIIIRI